MNKLILCTALMLISLQGSLFAQTDLLKPARSKTDATFNPCDRCIVNFKDVVRLKESLMTLELFRIEDYKALKNMDSILMEFRRDVAFYKDSLDPVGTGNVRIDYSINPKTNIKKIRFKKYPADGYSFVSRNGDVSKMKLEQDTVHIIIELENPMPNVITRKKDRQLVKPLWLYSIQATFTLNNYTDVDKIIADNADICHIIDTLEQTKQHYIHGNNNYMGGRSTLYKPYSTEGQTRFREFDGIINNELDFWPIKKKSDYLTADFNIGLGLVRNTLAPTLTGGLSIVRRMRNRNEEGENYQFYTLSVAPYFLFDKSTNGDYIANTNMFLNFQFGERVNDNYLGLKNKKASFGIGYLVLAKGGYFKNTTMKAFVDIQLPKGVTITPELIFTDNFKQVFPGITLKVF